MIGFTFILINVWEIIIYEKLYNLTFPKCRVQERKTIITDGDILTDFQLLFAFSSGVDQGRKP